MDKGIMDKEADDQPIQEERVGKRSEHESQKDRMGMNPLVLVDQIDSNQAALEAADCLLISVTSGKQFMQAEFGLRADEACTEAQAVELLRRTFVGGSWPYKFIVIDLDDPTIFLGRFKRTLKRLQEESGLNVAPIDVYACSDNNSEPMLQKCRTQNVEFLHKPLTRENCIVFAEKYPPNSA